MIRKLLPVALAVMTAIPAFSAFPFGSKVPKSDNRVSVFPGKVEKKETNRALMTRSEAPESVNFSYSGPVATALTLNAQVAPVGDTVYIAFEIPAKLAALYAGDEITHLNVTTGAYISGQKYINAVRNIKIFTAETKEDTPTCIQDAELGGDAWTEYSVELDNPVRIEGDKPLIIGYCFAVPYNQTYYIPIDMIPCDVPESSMVGVQGTNAEEPPVVWTSFADQYGATCLGCTIKGDNYPQSAAALFDMFGPLYAAPGKEFKYQFLIQGKCVSTETVEILSTIGKGEPIAQVVTLPKPLPYGEFEVIEIPLTCDEIDFTVGLKFELTKVNGQENTSERTVLYGEIECLPEDKVFPRVSLIEEGTGTWCGWCPRGIVMMEYASEEYPDLFACVALHSSDQMSTSTVSAICSRLFKNYPSAVINRTTSLSEMSTDEIAQFAAVYGTLPALMGFDSLEGVVNSDGNLNVDVVVKSGYDMDNKNRYRLAFYLVQNGMGPYKQTNNYAGGRQGEMGGWEKKGSSVETIYNDVARYIAGGFTGFDNSLPVTLKGGEAYSYSVSMPVGSVTADEFNLIAFIVDNQTGEIVNAKSVSVENTYYSGVSEIEGDSGLVARKFYNISGVEVKEPSNGIYIVRSVYSDGTVKTAKTVVK